MNKRFRACSLDQPYLLPPSLQDWLPSNHLARFIAEVAGELDLSGIYAQYERKDGRGLSAYHPLMLTRVLLYAYCIGVTSSRRIEKATYEDVAMRYLAADQHPDHDTIAAFRQENLAALGALFAQALGLCQRAGLVRLGNVALDGTKLQANASRQKSLSYGRMSEQEQRLKEIVERLLAEAERTDSEEDQRFGKGRTGDELPPELADAEQRLKRIREAKRQLEQAAAEALAAAQRNHADARKRGRPRKGEEPPGSRAERDKAKNNLRRARQNVEEPKRQHNFTDPDSRVMRDNGMGCFVQGYNAQIAVDGHAQVIVANDVTQDVVDRGQLIPMCARMKATLGSLPPIISADAGYWDTLSIGDPLLVRSTLRPRRRRDQTSICGNSFEPSTKIECELPGRPRNRRCGTLGGKPPWCSHQVSEERPVDRRRMVVPSHARGGCFPAGAARRGYPDCRTARSGQGRA